MIGSLLGKISQFECSVLMGNLVEGPSKDLKGKPEVGHFRSTS